MLGLRFKPCWTVHIHDSLSDGAAPVVPHWWNFLEICLLENRGKLFMGSYIIRGTLL